MNYSKFCLLVLILFSRLWAEPAEEQIRLLILDFNSDGRVSRPVVDRIVEIFQNKFRELNYFTILKRNDLPGNLAAQKLSDDCDELSC